MWNTTTTASQLMNPATTKKSSLEQLLPGAGEGITSFQQNTPKIQDEQLIVAANPDTHLSFRPFVCLLEVKSPRRELLDVDEAAAWRTAA